MQIIYSFSPKSAKVQNYSVKWKDLSAGSLRLADWRFDSSAVMKYFKGIRPTLDFFIWKSVLIFFFF